MVLTPIVYGAIAVVGILFLFIFVSEFFKLSTKKIENYGLITIAIMGLITVVSILLSVKTTV